MPSKPQKSKQANKKAPDAAARESPSLDWPVLEPLIPKGDLFMDEIYPNQIVTVSRFWTQTLCKKYVSFLSGLPFTTTPGKPKKGDAVRVNDRYQIDDPIFGQLLWEKTGLKELVLGYIGLQEQADETRASRIRSSSEFWGGEVIGLNPNIRIYRYKPGQFFDQHYDDSNNIAYPGQSSSPARTTWTLLLYLTSSATGCTGGETVFYPETPTTPSEKKGKTDQKVPDPIKIELETGMALLHKHGKDCMLHEGKEVTKGEKWVIRSDLCVKR